jgi:hypothetical protein
MYIQTTLLFYIFMLLMLGAVIAFSYFVIRPFQTIWALTQARKMVAENKAEDTWRFRNTYRMLATARNDIEAAELYWKLKEIRERAGKQSQLYG